MLNMLQNIINETDNDNKLFARYGFKFDECIKKYPNESRAILEMQPKFKNDFQLIFLSGLVEHFFPNSKPSWVSNKKLDSDWGYLSEYNINDNEKKTFDYYPEMVSRGIFAI